jgi:hypothetical protein
VPPDLSYNNSAKSICRHSNIKPKDLWNGDELSLRGKNTLWHFGLNVYDNMSYGTINRLEHATYIFRAEQPQMWDSYGKLLPSTAIHSVSVLIDASSSETLVLSQQTVILTHAAMPLEWVHQYDLSAPRNYFLSSAKYPVTCKTFHSRPALTTNK